MKAEQKHSARSIYYRSEHEKKIRNSDCIKALGKMFYPSGKPKSGHEVEKALIELWEEGFNHAASILID